MGLWELMTHNYYMRHWFVKGKTSVAVAELGDTTDGFDFEIHIHLLQVRRLLHFLPLDLQFLHLLLPGVGGLQSRVFLLFRRRLCCLVVGRRQDSSTLLNNSAVCPIFM